MDDETTPPFEPPATPPAKGESMISVGMVLVMTVLMAALIMGKFPTDATTVTALVGLITGFFATASTLVAMYIGQGQKPKSQTQ